MTMSEDMDENDTVFLIDDDPGIRDSLSLLLSLKGVRTQPFANAESFIETYRPEWTGCVRTTANSRRSCALPDGSLPTECCFGL